MFKFLKQFFGTAQNRFVRKYSKIVKGINEWDERFKDLSDDQLRDKTEEFRGRLKQGETLDDLLPEAYAVVKNVCRRLMGTDVHVSGYDQKWDMIPYDVQLIGAIAMHHGSIAEMETGEGKTITAVLPLYLNALTGKSVHLVTVNDYLAERDCQWVGCVLRWLGLTTGALTNSVPPHERKEIYACDVVYGTASEFGFDYLRDNSMALRKEDQGQRDHYFVIVDEIDSILIDEARTPLIISGPAPESKQMYEELKGGVSDLVRRQRDLCNRIATEAKKNLEQARKDEDKDLLEQACRKLWLVGKGTPRNRTLKRIKEDPDMRAELDKWDLYFYSDQNKEEKAEVIAGLFMIVDERGNEFELTDKGINAWHEVTGQDTDDFVMFDLGYEYAQVDQDPSLDEEAKAEKKIEIQEDDSKRKERAHNIRQLLRAHLMMEKDVDYIIQDGKIVIIDENTGRPQPGRRFADGLHQAIEAKEGVKIERETQTYATVTLQNYFRMYEKLAGMTGTAITEAGEFKEIYKLDVLQIPTHRPCVRADSNDEIYMTEREKYHAILEDVRKVHGEGRPILLGTESVEVSEKLARIFQQNQIPHVVLNAKNHAREAEIIAHAGEKGAIVIATNMAGRGTDIKLGDGITDLGGLYVLGTTRHQSRRTDRQLRGRCARQGDPGSSKFYISFEDSLMRLFASPRITTILQKFRPPEGEPISAGILNRSIETAQKRVEQRNYTIRKHTLEYDDVMNRQRKEIYSFRNEILHTDQVRELAKEIIETACVVGAEQFFQSKGVVGGWDPNGYCQWLADRFPVTFPSDVFDDESLDIEEIEKKACEKVLEAFEQKAVREEEKIPPKEEEDSYPKRYISHVMRNVMIRELDQLWQEHLLTMDHLRADVAMRTVGQRDPLMEFKHEAFTLFDELGQRLREKIAHALFQFEVVSFEPSQLQKVMNEMRLETKRSFLGEVEPTAQPIGKAPVNGDPQQEEPVESRSPVHVDPKVGRNDACPCGSGKKYKKCCGNLQEAEAENS